MAGENSPCLLLILLVLRMLYELIFLQSSTTCAAIFPAVSLFKGMTRP